MRLFCTSSIQYGDHIKNPEIADCICIRKKNVYEPNTRAQDSCWHLDMMVENPRSGPRVGPKCDFSEVRQTRES